MFYLSNWLIQLSHQPAAQNTSNYSVPTWQKRMIRWCKLRLRLTPMAWLEPFQECFMLGIMSSWTVNYLFGWNSLVFFLIHVLCWFLSDYTLLKITQVCFQLTVIYKTNLYYLSYNSHIGGFPKY